jgi:dTDP-glucose 4,6-dehydratase
MLTHVEDRPGHDRRYAIDPSKMETQLHWRAQTPFDTGLQETIDWYRLNTPWTDNVRSGAYRTYYDRMYSHRRQTLSER